LKNKIYKNNTKHIQDKQSNNIFNKPSNTTKYIYHVPIELVNQQKINIIPLNKQIKIKEEKTNLEILISNNESEEKILKIGNLKMLSSWKFFDNRKIIFYKNLNFEYYDTDKNELKGIIDLKIDSTAMKKDNFQFDLVAKGKVFSFISRREEDIKEWVEIINKSINEHKKCKFKKTK